MIRLLLAFFLFSLAEISAAQVAVVRSGAHDGFDRLVIDMPSRVEWRSELRDDGASLIFENKALRFDLDAVFARIGRARLRAISAPESGGRLDLDFACPCRLNVFWHASSMLVLDILDGEPAETSGRDNAPSQGMAGVPETIMPATRHSPASLTLAESIRSMAGPQKTSIPETRPSRASHPDLPRMTQTLLRQLGRAASQGLVTLSEPTRPRVSQNASAQADRVEDTENIAQQPAKPQSRAADAQPRSESQPNLRARTSMDRDIAHESFAEEDRGASKSCPSADFVDVRSWGGTLSFRSQIGRLNGSLYGEFDRLDKARALRLARLYIHHGFGAEARQVLDLLDMATPQVMLARELADLVDHVERPEGALADALHCGEPAVLWSLLAMPELPAERVFDHSALKRSFVALPVTLRRSLGPVLVRRLISAGHDGTAKAVFRLIGGKRERPGSESDFAQAALARRANEPAEADAALEQVVRRNTTQTGAALAERIETALRRDQPVTLADSELAGALAFEHRGTELGNRLAAVYLEALAASGAFDKAIREFDRLRQARATDTAPEVAARIVERLVNAADDVTFLRYITTDRLTPSKTLPERLVLAVADRLLGLGFVEQASRYLASSDLGENNRDARLLRAELFLAQGSAAEAELELVGLAGRDADILRAQALESRGEHAVARRLFAAHDETARADRAALHLGEADAMNQAQDGVLREVAQTLSASRINTSTTDAPSIEENHDLLDQSAKMRDVFRRLMATVPSSPSTN